MQAILFMGIQATGKSSFYQQHFFNSHVRISLDLLNTQNKQRRFLQTCFDTHTQFVIDNTNPKRSTRATFIEQAKAYKYEVVGYYFKSSLKEALERNALRSGKACIPEAGIRSCYSALEMPSFDEGFDRLYYVELGEKGFEITNWKDDV